VIRETAKNEELGEKKQAKRLTHLLVSSLRALHGNIVSMTFDAGEHSTHYAFVLAVDDEAEESYNTSSSVIGL
jgi:hypothetical protein